MTPPVRPSSRSRARQVAADPSRGPADVPLLTGNIPGAGGEIKRAPADFQVTEIPLYDASGAGHSSKIHSKIHSYHVFPP